MCDACQPNIAPNVNCHHIPYDGFTATPSINITRIFLATVRGYSLVHRVDETQGMARLETKVFCELGNCALLLVPSKVEDEIQIIVT